MSATGRRRATAAHWIPVLAYMAAIFVASAQPSLPEISPRVTDKHLHGVTYAGLSAVACRALAGGSLAALTPARAIGGWAVAAAYGVTDEAHQAFVPGRNPDFSDWLADASGAAAAAVVAGACGIIARSRRTREPRRTF